MKIFLIVPLRLLTVIEYRCPGTFCCHFSPSTHTQYHMTTKVIVISQYYEMRVPNPWSLVGAKLFNMSRAHKLLTSGRKLCFRYTLFSQIVNLHRKQNITLLYLFRYTIPLTALSAIEVYLQTYIYANQHIHHFVQSKARKVQILYCSLGQ